MGKGKINDIDLSNWKEELNDVWTDSLWLIPSRDKTGVHSRKYIGTFVPQIAHQILRRYTKPGDYVLDPFAGSGTTLIEAQRLNRNSVGVELLRKVVKDTTDLLKQEAKEGVVAEMVVGDSRTYDFGSILKNHGIEAFQSIIYHPPYWDIIKFSNDKRDLSSCKTLESFLNQFRWVVRNTIPYLEVGRYCALIIGDKYSKSELIPLGFYCMQVMQQEGLTLKATIVKNIEETRGKSGQISLWKYRSLKNGTYIFKHEYVFVFQKPVKKEKKVNRQVAKRKK